MRERFASAASYGGIILAGLVIWTSVVVVITAVDDPDSWQSVALAVVVALAVLALASLAVRWILIRLSGR
jgi:uncharacterized membrane protein YqjE